MSRMPLDRRTVLRGVAGGVAAALALPRLEAMLNGHGTAYADGAALPKRFVIWFWGCGMVPSLWTPKETGPNWSPPTANGILTPVASNPKVKPHVALLSGLQAKGGGSHYAVSTMLSGEYASAGYKSPTMDVVVTRAWEPKTKFPSLVLACSRAHKPGEGFPNISMNGPRNPNQPEYSPLKLYNRLFGAGLPDAGRNAGDLLKARQSMLDAVVKDASSLRGRLGATDRVRVDQHLENIRTIERQLTITPACRAPATTPPDAPNKGAREELETTDKAMTELMALAFACDLTRVVSYAFTTEETETIFWQVGANACFHDCVTHRLSEPGLYDVMVKAMTFQIARFAGFVERFAATTEGAGSLLDNTCVYATSGITDPRSHSTDDMPVMVAGRAGGRLKNGFHHRSTTKESTTNVLLTILNALDIPRNEFGVGLPKTSQRLSALEA